MFWQLWDLPYWNVPNRREYGEDNLIPGAPLSKHNKYILIQDMIKMNVSTHRELVIAKDR